MFVSKLSCNITNRTLPCIQFLQILLTPVPVAAMSENAEQNFNSLTSAVRCLLDGQKTVPPLGHDPTFQPASQLWRYDMIAREGEYYNTTEVSRSSSFASTQSNPI